MPSFDIVSEVDLQEARNAVDNASREVESRFDFRNVEASFELNDAKQNHQSVERVRFPGQSVAGYSACQAAEARH